MDVSPMQSLKPWNTFQVEAKADRITVAQSVESLCQSWKRSKESEEPVLILGEGSNVLFTSDFNGHVIINRIRGISVEGCDRFWRLHVGAGENWHQLVEYTLEQGYFGLENLALIPGTAGGAPIQNTGAYGVEFEMVCEYVDVVHLPEGTHNRLSAAECEFGYRDSIFKHSYRDNYAVTGIGLKLNKAWEPVLTYSDLRELDNSSVAPRHIFDAVCRIRRSKLPDPSITGNAGSFFKYPIVDVKHVELLKKKYPTMPWYSHSAGNVKLVTRWLIEQCCSPHDLRYGDAAAYKQHSAVLTNAGNASGEDIVGLARQIRRRVGETFNVWLEPEVRFIGSRGEVNAVEFLS